VFQGWRAYASSALSGLGGDWKLDLTLLDAVTPLAGVEITNPAPLARGGNAAFKINTTAPVTLVPWCKTEPYVTRTDPRGEAHNSSTTAGGVHPSTAIVVYFNAALDPDIDWSKWASSPGMVDIEARPVSTIAADGAFTNQNGWFDTVEYTARAGSYYIVITPKTGLAGPDAESQIKVMVGPSIRNAQGETMSAPEVFYYKVTTLARVDAKITGWKAEYNESAGNIAVTCSIAGTDSGSAVINASYRMNQGGDASFTLSGNGTTNNFSGTIGGVTKIDTSGVRGGGNVSGIREYDIAMDLSAGGYVTGSAVIKIWNIPGMSVSNTNPAIEITSASGDTDPSDGTLSLQAMAVGDSTKQYVLAQDITLSVAWIPVGTSSTAFQGKFYGNGHTVTFDTGSSFANVAYTGLFGYVSGSAIIRDLSVNYAVNLTAGTSATNMGGVTGRIGGNAVIRNTIVTGRTLSISTSSSSFIYTGSIAGYMQATAFIENCYTNLELSAASSGSGGIRAGGIAGYIDTTSVSASN
jgi:hypothetical protein